MYLWFHGHFDIFPSKTNAKKYQKLLKTAKNYEINNTYINPNFTAYSPFGVLSSLNSRYFQLDMTYVVFSDGHPYISF